jgi:hypothetical protein
VVTDREYRLANWDGWGEKGEPPMLVRDGPKDLASGREFDLLIYSLLCRFIGVYQA